MKIVLILLLLAVSSFAADSNAKAEKEVAAAMAVWNQAMVKGDAAALDKIYSADLVYEHSSAKNESKAEAIASATAPAAIAKSIDLRDVVTRIYGNTALVKAQGDFTGATGTVSHLDVLMVWVKSGQGWQLVSRQSTKLP